MNSQCCADMWKFLVRTVEIQISNTTRNITLEKPRTYFHSGYSSIPPSPTVSPGSSDTFQFSNPPCKGCVGVLVYEAAAFTLAIYFSNPVNYCLHSMELGLGLFQTDDSLKMLRDIYTRMSQTNSSPATNGDSKAHVTPGTCQEPAQVNMGHIKVTATMSNIRRSVIKVVVEEQEYSGKEPRRETCNQ